jgi:sterol desaturase/sphingolipid hydroxylase (fatty acid hydroxylase superfamily)
MYDVMGTTVKGQHNDSSSNSNSNSKKIVNTSILPSARSLRKWVLYNGVLTAISLLHAGLSLTYGAFSMQLLIFIAIRNVVLAWGVDALTKNSTSSSKRQSKVRGWKDDKGRVVNVLLISLLEVAAAFICLGDRQLVRNVPATLALFIPMSFVFEVMYDGFHYVAHRFMHSQRFLGWHKQHHAHVGNVCVWATFDQSTLDVVFSNTFPFLATFFLVNTVHSLDTLDAALLLTFKMFVEVCGHSGKDSFPSSSFPQFFWLPRWLGIELYAEDHNLHHELGNRNFAKRFALWDKLGDTFSSGTRR